MNWCITLATSAAQLSCRLLQFINTITATDVLSGWNVQSATCGYRYIVMQKPLAKPSWSLLTLIYSWWDAIITKIELASYSGTSLYNGHDHINSVFLPPRLRTTELLLNGYSSYKNYTHN